MKIAYYVLHCIVLIFNISFGYGIFKQNKSLKQSKQKQQIQKMLAETLSPKKTFLSKMEKLPEILQIFQSKSKINAYNIQSELFQESKEDQQNFFYVNSSYRVDMQYLDFISILENFKKDGLVFYIKEFTLENKENINSVFVHFITLAYEKI